MYILCCLDSDHYTDPIYKKFSKETPVQKLREYAEEDANSYFICECGQKRADDMTLEWDDDDMRLTARGYDINDEEFFVVYEIKQVPDADYIVGYHRAYGVEFEVKTATSIEVARAVAKTEADALYALISSSDDASYDTLGINQRLVDDGSQWHVWSTYYMTNEVDLAA